MTSNIVRANGILLHN
ncbi:MAG: hypothetical protein EOL98_11625 [Negativicutes bacterium]|nr:hypothetical protein [Negativicutes bacterium]